MNGFDRSLGLAIIFGMAAGVVAFLAAIYGVLIGEWIGSGLCFLSAGITFGLISNGLLRR